MWDRKKKKKEGAVERPKRNLTGKRERSPGKGTLLEPGSQKRCHDKDRGGTRGPWCGKLRKTTWGFGKEYGERKTGSHAKTWREEGNGGKEIE